MTTVERRRDVTESLSTGDDAVATAPRIVNGLTVRPRKKVSLWPYGLLLLPDFAVPLVIAGLGMRRLLRYLDAKRPKLVEQPLADVSTTLNNVRFTPANRHRRPRA